MNSQPVQNEETRIQKNKESLRRFCDISKRANIQIIGVPEEEEEQEIENLFEKIMKENFPNLAKEIDTSPGSTESKTSWSKRGPHQDTS